MTNLPITSSNPQSPATATPGSGMLPAPRPSEGRASGGVPFTGVHNDPAAPTSQANGATNDQFADTFSFLLAQQIGDAGLPAMNTTQIYAAIDSKVATGNTNPTAKDVQDQNTIATGTSSDPANTLAAMLLQIPVQQTDVPAKATPVVGTPLPLSNTAAEIEHSSIEPLIKRASGIKQNIEDNLQQTSSKSREKDNVLAATSNKQQSELPSSIPVFAESVKHVEIVVSSAGQPHTSQNNTNTATSAPESAVMLNTRTSNIPSDLPQTIATPLGKSGWAEEFSQKIVWMSTQQNQIAELHLNPPDLGPLNVVMKISDNQLTAQFTSPHSAVRDALENALPKLREILANNNIMLGNTTVSDQPPRERSGDGFMNQNSSAAAQSAPPHIAAESNGSLLATAQNIPARRHNGLLDTFA